MTCGLLNSQILGTSIGTYQPETTAWIIRTEAAGGTISNGTKDAVDAFVVSCKGAGIFTKFKRLNLFCGNNFTACLSPLVNTAGTTMETNSGMSAGNYSQAGGLVGGSGSLNTGLVPNTTLAYNNWHMAAYIIASSAANRMDMGCLGHPSGNIQMRFTSKYGTYGGTQIGSITISGDYNGGANQAFQTYGTAITNGLALASRTSASSLRVRNTSGSVNVVNTLAYSGIQALPTAVFWAMGANGAEITLNTVGGYSIGLGLSDVECASYCSIMQTFQAALGRST